MAKKWSDERILYTLKEYNNNKAQTARVLDIPRSTVWRVAKRHSVSAPVKVVEAPSVRQVRESEAAANKSAAEAAQEKKRRIAAEQDLAELQQATSVLNEIESIQPVKMKLKTPKAGSKSIATAIYGASDWHSEANVQPDIVNGLNEFTPDICKKRVTRFFQKAVYLTEFTRNICEIRDGVLWLGGDLINGYIHEELEESNFFGPAEAIAFVSELVVGGIDHLIAHAGLDHLRVVCNVGNHGRSTKKRRVSTGYRSSWEYLAYVLLAARYKDNPKVSWIIPRGYFAYVDIQGWNTRFSHGENVNYQGGVGGITIPVNKAIAGWNKARPADFDYFGHFHQFVDNWSWVCNGPLVGYDGYALSIKADYQPPTQLFSVIDRDRGKTLTIPIFVETAGYGEQQ